MPRSRLRPITFLPLLALLPLAGAAAAQQPQAPDYSGMMAEAAWDWRPGDLFFRNGMNAVDATVARALGLRWETVGILRPSSGGPRVVYVDEDEGVTEEMLYVLTDGLSARGSAEDSAGDYAVYRLRLPGGGPAPEAQVGSGPAVRMALDISYGAPFDPWFLLGNGAFYGADLAYEGALNAGVVAGVPVRLGDLVADPGTLDPAFRALLEAHRYCRYELSFDACWDGVLADQAIVTTDSLIGSGMLERVFP